MNAEQFAWAYIKSEFLYPKRLLFQSEDLYHACMEETLALGEKTRGDGAALLKKREQRARKKTDEAEKRRQEGVVRLIKTLQQALKMDREKFKVPRSVQQAIPIQRIWPDGVFQSGTKFSKSFRFSDINYAIASKEDKTEMFLDYSELLNALDSGASAKITLNNRRINKEEFEASLLLPMKEDELDDTQGIQRNAVIQGQRHQQQHLSGTVSDGQCP